MSSSRGSSLPMDWTCLSLSPVLQTDSLQLSHWAPPNLSLLTSFSPLVIKSLFVMSRNLFVLYIHFFVLFFRLMGFCFFFFFLLSNITLYTYFTVYLFISAEISLSLVFTVMNIATRNIQIQVFAETCFSFILGKILGVGLLGLLVNVCLIF